MLTSRWTRIIVGFVLATISLSLLLGRSTAAGPGGDPRDKFRGGDTVEIPSGETINHDLYVSGGTVRIAGRVDGDLFVLGGTVDLSGPVTGDLFVVGGNVSIASAVDRSLRVAGGNATVSSSVKQDLLAATGTLTVTSAAHIGGDLIFGGGRTQMDGSVAGSVLGSAQSYTRGGSVSGTESVTLREEHEEQRERVQERRAPSALDGVLDQLRRFVGIAIAGALLILLLPALVRRGEALVRERPLPSLGVGALTFVCYFALMAALLVAMILVAIPLGALGLGRLVLTDVIGVLLAMGVLSYLFALVLLFLGVAVVGLAIGRLILTQVSAPWARIEYVPMLLGVLILVIVTALPFIGGLVNFAAILLGLGGLTLVIWQLGPAVTASNPLSGGPV